MGRSRTASKLVVGVIAAATLIGAAAAGPASASSPPKGTALKGLFTVVPGASAAGGVTGSYFRMVQPGGTVAAGPFVPNANSAATDKTYTLLTPGTAGGLVTGSYQPAPNPPFDAAGNGTASAIVAPTQFFGVAFALATNKVDPQTNQPTKVPSITAAKTKLAGDLDALGVDYGKQHFNQGAPKPDGSRPDGTAGPTGTYNAKTGKYTLDWSSAIVGGPFNGFTGVWHLTGTFKKGGK